MKVTPVKTHKITLRDKDLLKLLDRYLPRLKERSVVAISSKIVAICEGRVVKMGLVDKDELIKNEAELYLPRHENRYHVSLTITDSKLVATAGIDESNGDGYYILWPKRPQKTVNAVRSYLKKKHKLINIGVVLTDSVTTPLRMGVTGTAISHCGFSALNNYIGKTDIFGRRLEFTKVSIMNGLAAASVVATGEGKEQTPLAVIEDVPFVKFQDRNPTKKELKDLNIVLEDDLYAPMLTKVKWLSGKKKAK